jgi:hypothetical protein
MQISTRVGVVQVVKELAMVFPFRPLLSGGFGRKLSAAPERRKGVADRFQHPA